MNLDKPSWAITLFGKLTPIDPGRTTNCVPSQAPTRRSDDHVSDDRKQRKSKDLRLLRAGAGGLVFDARGVLDSLGAR
jgi:hypothetical protein